VADGAEAELVFSHVPQLPAAMQLLLDYRDLTGRTYSTAIVITVNVGQNQERRISFYDVRTFRDTTLTTHGDSLPQGWTAGAADRRARLTLRILFVTLSTHIFVSSLPAG
jgi:hypothetical protein